MIPLILLKYDFWALFTSLFDSAIHHFSVTADNHVKEANRGEVKTQATWMKQFDRHQCNQSAADIYIHTYIHIVYKAFYYQWNSINSEISSVKSKFTVY